MRRVIAAVAAVLLAALGAVVLNNYVRNADERALEGIENDVVLVAKQTITAGLSAESIAGLVEEKALPRVAIVEGAVADLADLEGQVTVAQIEAGEQLIAARFGSPEDVDRPVSVAVPEGLQSVTVKLAPERVIGGRLIAGQEVGVFVSISPDVGPYNTKLVVNRVLVTRVDGGVTDAPVEDDAQATAPTDLLVTLAVTTEDAEQIVFGVEHGTVWLSLQSPTTNLDGSRIVDPGNIYE